MDHNARPGGSGRQDEYEVLKRAAKFLDEGTFGEAEQLLTTLTDSRNYREEAQALLGSLLFKTDRLDEAIACFMNLSVTDPSSESYSLGLFHSLWRAERSEEAFAEMRRFRADYESMEYRRLIRNFKAEGYEIP